MEAIPGLGFLPSDFNSQDPNHTKDTAQEVLTTSHDVQRITTAGLVSQQNGSQTESQEFSSTDKTLLERLNTHTNDDNHQVSPGGSPRSPEDFQNADSLLATPAGPSSNPQNAEQASDKMEVENSSLLDATSIPLSDPRETGPEEAEPRHNAPDSVSTDEDSSGSSSASDSGESSPEDEESYEDGISVDDDYELLDPAEQARILMKGDADEDSGGRNGNASAPRTANEQIEEKTQKPDIVITADMEIEELGIVESVVESFALVKGTSRSEIKVLASGSPLCLDNRTIIGSVAEPVGRVDDPHYSVAFNTVSEMGEFGICKGSKIFYPVQFADYVFTQPLKSVKGSDASNIHDEEVGREEMEFSDDEAEAAYKRQKKLALQSKKANGIGANGSSQKPNHRTGFLPNDHMSSDEVQILKYEDDDNDEPYTPLARPPNLYSGSDVPLPPSRNQYPSRTTSRSNRWRGNPRGNHGAGSQRVRRRNDGQDHKDAPKQAPTGGQNAPAPFQSQHSNHSSGVLPYLQRTPWLYPQSSTSLSNNPFQLPGARVSGSAQDFAQAPMHVVGQSFMPGVPPGAYVNPTFFSSQQPLFQAQQARQADHGPNRRSANAYTRAPLYQHPDASHNGSYNSNG